MRWYGVADQNAELMNKDQSLRVLCAQTIGAKVLAYSLLCYLVVTMCHRHVARHLVSMVKRLLWEQGSLPKCPGKINFQSAVAMLSTDYEVDSHLAMFSVTAKYTENLGWNDSSTLQFGAGAGVLQVAWLAGWLAGRVGRWENATDQTSAFRNLPSPPPPPPPPRASLLASRNISTG